MERWKATLEKAAADLSRSTRLLPTGAVSQEEYDLNVAQVKLNEAEIKGAEANLKQAQLDLGWTEIKAPFDGRIGKCNFSEGDLIPLGNAGEMTTLTTIVSTQNMWVYFTVPERTVLTYQQQVRKEGKDPRPEHIKNVRPRSSSAWPLRRAIREPGSSTSSTTASTSRPARSRCEVSWTMQTARSRRAFSYGYGCP